MSTSLCAEVRFGEGIGLVAPGSFAVLDRAAETVAARLWSLLEAGSGLDDLLDELSSLGIRSLGDLVLAQVEPDGVRFVLRGRGRASVVRADVGEQLLEARGVRTWVEEFVSGVVHFSLDLAPGTGPGEVVDGSADRLYPVRSGMVPVDHLRWPAQVRDPFATAGAVPATEVPAEPSEMAPVPEDHPVAHTDEVDGGEDVSRSDDADHGEDVSRSDDADHGEDYDELYGHTIARSVQQAAIHHDDEPSGELDDGADPVALIQDVPEVGAPSPDGEPERAGPSPDAGDHDGLTIGVAQLGALRAGGGEPVADVAAPSMGGPSVRALLCERGHPNPTHLEVCFRCSSRLGTEVQTIARPKLGVLRVSTGEVIELDRPAIVGRKPRIEGAVSVELPRLVGLDVGQALSRSHAAIRLEGWQVFVEDLGSANGTIVTVPGREPQRLRRGEPVLITTGAEVDLGGEVVLTYDETA